MGVSRQSVILQLGVLVLLAINISATAEGDDTETTCPQNQVYSNCKPCLNTCEGNMACSRDCQPGCGCPEDLPYQLQDGSCVLDCPAKEETFGCPLHSCTVDMLGCEAGRLLENENGCELCECAPVPSGDPPGCPLHGCTADMLGCQSGQLQVDGRGCLLCQCAGQEGDDTETTCPQNQVYSDCKPCLNTCEGNMACSRDCLPGCGCPEDLPYQLQDGSCVFNCPAKEETFGCPLHSCTVDMLGCEAGRLLENENGCELCECAPVPSGDPPGCPFHGCTADMLGCQSGQLQVDGRGCLLCQCAGPDEADLPVACLLHGCRASVLGCASGQLKIADNGCELCECAEGGTGDDNPVFVGGPMAGGFHEWLPATDEIQAIVDQVRDEVEALTNRVSPFTNYEPKTYRSQVVAGMNYDIRLDVGEDEYLEISVFESLPLPQSSLTVTGIRWVDDDGQATDEDGDGEDDTTAAVTCPFNQVYSECKKCDETCGKRKKCYRNCVAGCTCPEQLPFQTKKGKCVAECPKKKDKNEKKCPHNQKYSECVPCLQVCGKGGKVTKEMCNRNCLPGCACPEELPFQTKKGKCVAECPAKKGKDKKPKCPKNQKYSDCATACPLVCGEPRPEICTAACEAGCTCTKNRWLREDGKCVKEKKCPK